MTAPELLPWTQKLKASEADQSAAVAKSWVTPP